MSDSTSGNQPEGLGLLTGMERGGLSLTEVWWCYIALGGRSDLPSFADQVAGMAPVDGEEHDLIAQAINERLLERGVSSFPVKYESTSRGEPPRGRTPVAATGPRRVGTDQTGARERAAAMRVRSANASRQAAILHLNAARLLSASGQIRLAQLAMERSQLAQARFKASQV